MFCPNCGKEIGDNQCFCSECGKPVGTKQPAAPQNNSNGVKTNKKRNIILSLAVSLTVFILVRLIIAPIIANSYTKDLPVSSRVSSDAFEFDVNSYVSIKSDVETENTTDNKVSAPTTTGASKTKVYEIKAEGVVSSQINFIYSSDGMVKSIIGYMNIYDFNADGSADIMSKFDTAKRELDKSTLSGAKVEVNRTDFSYSSTFSFTGLDMSSRKTTAEVAAGFIGIPYENGKISISTTNDTLLNSGYTLINEY